jgi:hypothetical protein
MHDDRRLCSAVRKDGAPCALLAVGNADRCFAHVANTESRAAGGRAKAHSERAGKLLPARLRPVLDQLLTALDEVHAGSLTPQQGSAMSALAGAVVKVMSAGQFEERLRDLEAALEKRTA